MNRNLRMFIYCYLMWLLAALFAPAFFVVGRYPEAVWTTTCILLFNWAWIKYLRDAKKGAHQ